MKWDRSYTSGNVEDRRGMGKVVGVGGLLVALVLSLIFGKDFVTPLMGGGGEAAPAASGAAAGGDELGRFVAFVHDDALGIFRSKFSGFRDSRLVLYDGSTSSGCGAADAATGPFYCPADEKVYIDLSFYRELHERFGAPGNFAEAYVVAHEVGHHVQHLTGADARVRAQQRANPDQENALSVQIELQADCYAGVWAKTTQGRGLLEANDIENALTAAAAIGDDRLQQQSGRGIRPESWTHGSSAQRMAAFRRGFDGGDMSACGQL